MKLKKSDNFILELSVKDEKYPEITKIISIKENLPEYISNAKEFKLETSNEQMHWNRLDRL